VSSLGKESIQMFENIWVELFYSTCTESRKYWVILGNYMG